MAFNLKKNDDYDDFENIGITDPLEAKALFNEKYGNIKELKISQLIHPEANKFTMDEDDRFIELKENIEKDGFTEVITVTPVENGKFEIVSGNRRVEAAKAAGKNRVNVKVIAFDDEEEKAAFIYRANGGKRNENPFGNAATVKYVLETAGIEITPQNKTVINDYLRTNLNIKDGGSLTRIFDLVLLDNEIIDGGKNKLYAARTLLNKLAKLNPSEKTALLSQILDVLQLPVSDEDKKNKIATLLADNPPAQEKNKGGRPKKIKKTDEILKTIYKSIDTAEKIYTSMPDEQDSEKISNMINELIERLQDLNDKISQK